MAAWIDRGRRLDIELSVALEIGRHQMDRAETARQRDEAIRYNSRLWAAIRHLAYGAPLVEDRDGLVAGAGQVLDSPEPHRIRHFNTLHAARLARRAATGGALRGLLGEWDSYRADRPRAELGAWLLDRFEAQCQAPPMAA